MSLNLLRNDGSQFRCTALKSVIVSLNICLKDFVVHGNASCLQNMIKESGSESSCFF